MFLLNKKKVKYCGVKRLFLFGVIFFILLINSFDCDAESKIIISKNNKKLVNQNYGNYRIITNMFSNTKALVDEKNNIIIHTTSSKDKMGYLYDNVTKERKFVWIMTPNDASEYTPAVYTGQRDYDYKIYNKYSYYDFDGNKINTNDEKMYKIEYLIGNYMVYNTWNEKEPEMKAYKINENKVITLGNYNYLDIVDNKIILSKDVYGCFYEYGWYQRDDEEYEGFFTKGDNKMMVCDMDFEEIKSVDKYSYMGKSSFNNKTYYKVYFKDSREQKDYRNNVMINFLDEKYNVVLDMPVYDCVDDEGYLEERDAISDITSEKIENINAEKKESDNTLNKANNKKNEKDIYLLKDIVKIYNYNFNEGKIENVVDGEILSDKQMDIYKTSDEFGRYTFNNGVIRLLINKDGKYRLYDKYFNLIYDKEIVDPVSNDFKCYKADTLETAMFSISINGKTSIMTFDENNKYIILNDRNGNNEFKSANNAYYYLTEKHEINTENGKRKVDVCIENNIYNIKNNDVVKLKSEKEYKNIKSILIGKDYYFDAEYIHKGYGDLFDSDGNIVFEEFSECTMEPHAKHIGKEIFVVRLFNEKLICNSKLNILCKFTRDFEYFVPIEKDGKVLYKARLYNYGGTENKNWTVYYALLDSNFNFLTDDYDYESGRITYVNAYEDYVCVTFANGNEVYYDYDGRIIKKQNSEKKHEKHDVIYKEINIVGKKYHLSHNNDRDAIDSNNSLYNLSKYYCTLYDDKNNIIDIGYYICAFTDGTFIVQEQDELVYFDEHLNRKIIMHGNYLIDNCKISQYMDISTHTDEYVCPLNEKKNYYVLSEYKENKRYALLGNEFNIILNDFKGLSECDNRYVNYLRGFNYGLYDVENNEFVSSYNMFDNFDDDEEDYEHRFY